MRTWFFLLALYGAFLYWYGGWGRPLSPEEVAVFGERAERLALEPELAERLLAFAKEDDGREFFMVNLNRYRDEPRYADGRPTGNASAQEVESRYVGNMLPRLLSRACHPWIAVEPIAFLLEAGAPEYHRATIVRYRSRHDFLEIVLTDTWREDAEHKWAALEIAHSFPSRARIRLPGPRAGAASVLLLVGLLLNCRRGRGARTDRL